MRFACICGDAESVYVYSMPTGAQNRDNEVYMLEVLESLVSNLVGNCEDSKGITVSHVGSAP
jgi:hypothetical protein